MRVQSSQNFYTKIMLLFFLMLVVVYGRSMNFNARLDEAGEVNYSELDTSKAPFLIGMTLFLFFLTPKKYRLNFQHIANIKLWVWFFLLHIVLIVFRNNFAPDLTNFGTLFFSYAVLFLLLRFIYQIPYSRLEDIFINISLVISVVCVLFHLNQGNAIVFFPDRSDDNFDRLGGLFYYSHTAAVVSITLLFSFKKYLDTKKVRYMVFVAVCILLLIATDTRSAWFATAFSMFILYFKNVRFYKLLILAVVFYLAATSYSSMVSSGTSVSATQDDSKFRMEIWGYSLTLAYENLFVGYGSVNPLEGGQFVLTEKLRDPHNSIISLLLQSGLIGTILYFVIYFKNCNRYLKFYNPEYRFLFFFWLFFPFFWGKIYNNLSSFLSMYMMFSIYVFALNPSKIKLKS